MRKAELRWRHSHLTPGQVQARLRVPWRWVSAHTEVHTACTSHLGLQGPLGSWGWECAEGSAESRGAGPPLAFFCAERTQLYSTVETLLTQRYTDIWEGVADSSLRRKFFILDLEALYPSALLRFQRSQHRLSNGSAAAHVHGPVDTST